MNIYQQQIMEHYHHPQNVGEPASFSLAAVAENISCGDETKVFLTLDQDNLASMHHITNGCAICVASASLLSQELAGKNINQILTLDKANIEAILGIELTPARLRCGLLPLEAVKTAIKHSNSEHN